MTEQNTPKMTHDEMIDILKGLVFGTFDRTTAKEREALDMSIKALEALDKIRAEIDAHRETVKTMADDDWYAGKMVGFECAIEIIDKYREREGV